MVAGGRLSDLDEGGRAAARISAAGVVQCPALCDPLWHRVAGDAEGIKLEVVKLPEAKRGFVLLPRRWVVERSFAWATRCRRLVKDYERHATTLAGFYVIAF